MMDIGEICNKPGCDGLYIRPDGHCSCHISPPCGWCCKSNICSECGES